MAFENGRGVPQLITEAVSWYRQAALQGNAAGQFNYGRLYAEGKGVSTERRGSRGWFEKAAKQGHAQAKARLRTVSYSFHAGSPTPPRTRGGLPGKAAHTIG
ncbi:MAG: tetratricopeptide repeat protein [Acidobacteriota bacterium]